MGYSLDGAGKSRQGRRPILRRVMRLAGRLDERVEAGLAE
jgi:hypothetical protein